MLGIFQQTKTESTKKEKMVEDKRETFEDDLTGSPEQAPSQNPTININTRTATATASSTSTPSSKSKKKTFITLEVHHARGRDPFKTAKPYLREPILIDFNPPNNNINNNQNPSDNDNDKAKEKHNKPLTFRSFLRSALFDKRPELKYRDNAVVFYQTPKGTNLLNIMDEPIIDALPDLLGRTEQRLLKVIIQTSTRVKDVPKADGQSSSTRTTSTSASSASASASATLQPYKDPNGYIPAWPRTKLEGPIPEDNSVMSWVSRPFKLDEWKHPKTRRRLIIICSILFIIIAACVSIMVIFLLPKRSSVGSGDGFMPPGGSPTDGDSDGGGGGGGNGPPSKFDQLKEIVSEVTDLNLINKVNSPQRLALDWLSYDDGADLGSNLCTSNNDSSGGNNGDYYNYDYYNVRGRNRNRNRKHKRTRTLVADTTCNDAERVIRRYALAVFYYATRDKTIGVPLLPPVEDGEDDYYYTGGDLRRRMTTTKTTRRSLGLFLMDDLNFLTGLHECSWHRNVTTSTGTQGGENVISTQGVICRNEVHDNGSNGHIVLGNDSSVSTFEAISLEINGKCSVEPLIHSLCFIIENNA